MRKSVATTVALCSLLASAGPANAIDFNQLLRGIVDQTVNSAGLTQPVVKQNINVRQAQLEQEIEAGVKTGQITPGEEKELRNDLNAIAHQEALYLQDRRLDQPEVTDLIDRMTALSAKIKSYLTNATTAANCIVDHDKWFRTHPRRPGDSLSITERELRQAHLSSRTAELDATIEQGVLDGSINWTEARDLRATLNRIKGDQYKFLADGRLQFDEEKQLRDDLNKLSTRITKAQYTNRRRGRRDRRWRAESFMARRIGNAVDSGKISRKEAYRLYDKERQIKFLERRLKNRGNTLTFEQERDMFRRLERLHKDVNDKLLDV